MSNHEAIVKLIKEMDKRMEENDKELEAHDYDGIIGLPPDWIGEPRINEFRHHRNRMLRDWSYSTSIAKEWLDRFVSDNSNDWYYPATYPNGYKLESDLFRDTVGFLARLRWCASLEPEEGLRELAGERAAQGYKTWLGSKQSRKDTLTILMEEIYSSLLNTPGTKPTNNEVLEVMEKTASGRANDTIQEISRENEKIYWIDIRGKEQTTSFSRFRNRMTRIRADSK